MAEAQQRHRPDQHGAFVESSRQADRVGEAHTGAAGREERVVVGEEYTQEPWRYGDVRREPERAGHKLVGALGVEAEKEL
jgi:hypothetical protein